MLLVHIGEQILIIYCGSLTRENRRHHSGEHEKHHRKENAAGIAHYLRGFIADIVINCTDKEPNDYMGNQPYSR